MSFFSLLLQRNNTFSFLMQENALQIAAFAFESVFSFNYALILAKVVIRFTIIKEWVLQYRCILSKKRHLCVLIQSYLI